MKIFLELYEKGIITKMELFMQLREHDLEPPDEFKEEYVEWCDRTPPGSPSFCIVA